MRLGDYGMRCAMDISSVDISSNVIQAPYLQTLALKPLLPLLNTVLQQLTIQFIFQVNTVERTI